MRVQLIRVCALIALTSVTPACLSGSLTRVNAFDPVADTTIEQLEPGVATLADCLRVLGAPLDVYQHEHTGVVLSYGWFRGLTWAVTLSIPLGDSSGSINYTDQRDRMQGFLLFFDERRVLQSLRSGFVGDLEGMISDAPPDVVDD